MRFASGLQTVRLRPRRGGASIGLDGEQFDQCYEEAEHAGEVASDLREAERFYILGTPTFFINGQRMEGAQSPENFATVIDALLAGS